MMQADDDDVMKAFAQLAPSQLQQPQPLTTAVTATTVVAVAAATQPAAATSTTMIPPTTTNGSNNIADPLPYSLYDVILDIPHPGASHPTPIQIIYPPSNNKAAAIVDSLPIHDLISEFGPDGVSKSPTPLAAGTAKIARFAFPEYEDTTNAKDVMLWHQQQSKLQWNASNSQNLNKYDGYLEGVYSHVDQANAAGGAAGGGATNVTGGGDNYSLLSTSSSPLLPSNHVFSHRLGNGTIVHGHVRRYLPFHQHDDNTNSTDSDEECKSVRQRRDVGRRSIRALVILTRHSGGGNRLYTAMLKSVEIILLQQQMAQHPQDGRGDVGDNANEADCNKLRWFLHSIHQEHVNLCRTVGSAILVEEQQKIQGNNASSPQQQRPALSIPRIITLPLVELGRGHGLFGSVDLLKFVVPTSFLHGRTRSPSSSLSRNDMMPMLRCLGVPRTMRLLSALLSEKRVVLMCNDPAKLSAVAYGVASMMGQGLLTLSSPSRGLFVPILPPGLASLLQTPSAYLIGVLTGPSGGATATSYINLRTLLPSIAGELVIFDLDITLQQGYDTNDPYFHNVANPQQSVPDLTRRNVDDYMDATRLVSSTDVLHQDLTECLRMDKKLFVQAAVQEKLGMAAAKGKKVASAAVKKGLNFLRGMSERADSALTKSDSERAMGDGEEDLDEEGDGNVTVLSKLVGKGNYAYENGYSSEKSEEDARIAFTSFFVELLGDIRSYLTQQAPGTLPVQDKQKFVKFRVANGDAAGSGMFFLVSNFVRSQMFDSFVEARLKEVQMRRAVPDDSPLFALVTNYHRLNKIDFSMNSVRQTARQIATQNNIPGRYLIDWNTTVRDRVSLLTTTQQTFNVDFERAVAQLTEDCSESSALLIDTMMVLWTRMQEGRGMQWKKTLLALQIFRNLLLHGPLNVIAEGIDGFASIRILKSYTETLRGQNSKLIRDVAMEIYSLLVDLPVLFARRRQCMNSRRLVKDPKPSLLRKETRMVSGISKFRNIHTALRPAGAVVAPAPVQVDDLLLQRTTPSAFSSSLGSGTYSDDLLSMNVAASSSSQVTVLNTTGVGAPPMIVGAPQPGNYSSDLLSLSFGAPPATSKAESGPGTMLDPFSMYEMSQAAAATMPLSQPSPQQSAPAPVFASSVPTVMSSQPFQSVPNAPTLAQNVQVQLQPSHTIPFNAMASGAMSYQPVQNAQQQFQPRDGMNQYMMPNLSMQAQPQPSLMNPAFSTGICHPMSQPTPQQSQRSLNGPPMYNPPRATAGGYPIIQMAPQNQQGAYSNFPSYQKPNAHGQK